MMGARRRRLTVVAVLCGLACVLAVTGSAVAATQIGSAGSGAGQFDNISGIAVDQETGAVYVGDRNNLRIDEFEASGGFLAWGWNVNAESPTEELQTCTTACKAGSTGTGTGEFSGEAPHGVAVDSEPLSLEDGDVYVVDWGNFRVEKFDSSGKFLLMFGGGVNETTKGDVCVAGEACKAGSSGIADGQFKWDGEGGTSYIAVGPGGDVYVGDRARVQVFEPSGVWKEDISLSALSSEGKVSQLAVDGSGDMFVKDEGVPGVREFGSNGVEKGTPFDVGSESVQALAVDGSGDLFVADSNGGFHVSEYSPAGTELESFGSKAMVTTAFGMAFSDESDELYIDGEYEPPQTKKEFEPSEQLIRVISPPPPGPLVESGSESAVAGERGVALLEATVNPEGYETTYQFQYVGETDYRVSGFANASSTPALSLGSSFEDQLAHVELTKLVVGETYHYRIVATNANGVATGLDQSLEETPAALVDGPWASDVSSASVTLSARIDPLGVSTQYRLEYGTSAPYGHVFSGSVGEGTEYVQISFPLQGLQPDTTYHYRLVTSNEVGVIEGVDHAFSTQLASGGFELPDGRAWELVSPANKKGAVIEPFEGINDIIQAAADGSAITYPTVGPAVGENPQGRAIESTVLSSRGPGGWGSTDIDIPRRTAKEGETTFSLAHSGQSESPLFSQDLSLAVVEPTGDATPLLSPEATERTLYLRDDTNASYLPLVTSADVPSGTKFGGEESITKSTIGGLTMQFVGASPDLSHVVFRSPLALTAEAVSEFDPTVFSGPANLYEWAGGRLQLVNILPDGEAMRNNSPSAEGADLAGADGQAGLAPRPISAEGRWVAWTWNRAHGLLSATEFNQYYKGLYVRDTVGEKTFQVGGLRAQYQTMTSDGSRVFFVENGDLYEFDTATDTQTDLTAAHGGGEESAGVKESVSDVSEDGSYVYFVASGVLAAGGIGGSDNLYLLHETDRKWTTTHIATLSPEDEKSWYEAWSEGTLNLAGVSSRVSPDGRYLTFMSNRSLTGYDNLDANSSQPDEEVFLYDADTARLVCASCNPTGARPVGMLDSATSKLLVDNTSFWGNLSVKSHWLAGSIPGWMSKNNGQSSYQPRYLSDGGRLFFNSPDALVPKDTNGLEDVYEYEPSGVAGCATDVSTFSERSDGCVSLISSGTSSSESVFYDASENGDDVFFLTASRLTASDYDDSFDVYDAHVCSVSLPCVAEPVSPPACTSGDACKVAPSPQPEIFGPTPSATFSGTGNVVVSASGGVKPKALTRAQQLARALTACHKKRKRKRVVCERQARKRYPVKRSHESAKATGKNER